VASKNGLGAVLGRKRVKALVALNGKSRVPLHDPRAFKQARQVAAEASVKAYGGLFHKNGTGILVHIAHDTGVLPIKNYQTNLLPGHSALDAQVTRRENQWVPERCFACRVAHCAQVSIAKGPYAGLVAPGARI
jgi:aldehyde:ferredoxin oxidoreductase